VQAKHPLFKLRQKLYSGIRVSERVGFVLVHMVNRLNTTAVTLYVDLSRYTEKPVETLRTQFQYWLDKAMWHRPSVLVFDNLEKLLGAELEVFHSFYQH
jgi:hypothetical protein